MRKIDSHEAHPLLLNLTTLSNMGFGFAFAPERDVVVVDRMDGVKVEFTLKEVSINDVKIFKEMAHKALMTLSPKTPASNSKPIIRRKKVK